MPSSPETIRVVLAEPEPLLRDGLACVLEEHPEVALVGEAANAERLGRAIRQLEPHVVLADTRLLDGTLLDSARGDGFGARPVRVVALVEERPAEPLRRRVLALLDDGVAGFVSTKDRAETLLEAVCVVARGGEVYLSPLVAARLSPPARRDTDDAPLTPREREVLRRAALGRSNARIAEDLGLAPGTVRNHLSAAYAKLGVRTRAEAVAWAWCYGHVRPDDLLSKPKREKP